MRATSLSGSIWNAMADLVRRSSSPREIYFSEVTKTDAERGLVWCKDFGDVAIPIVVSVQAFAYYDTVPTGIVGSAVTTRVEKREDKTHRNANYLTDVVVPPRGEVVVILDPWGAKRFPVCLGVLTGGADAWRVD
jgi:hypothetical protein